MRNLRGLRNPLVFFFPLCYTLSLPYTNTLKVFEKLRPVFEEKQDTAVAEAIDEALETNDDVLLEKFDARIEKRLAELKSEMVTTILKWMVALWITQMFAIFLLFFKK